MSKKVMIREAKFGKTRQVNLSLALRLAEQGRAVIEPAGKPAAKAKREEKPSKPKEAEKPSEKADGPA